MVSVRGTPGGARGPAWYDADGTELSGLSGMAVLSAGYEGTALIAAGVVDLATGALAPLAGLSSFEALAARARPDGYWIAAQPTDRALPPELWHVAFDGTATLLGTYPSPPPNQIVLSQVALDGMGRLLQFALGGNAPSLRDTIIRRSIEGDSEIVYDEDEDPIVKLHISALFTGP